MSKPKVLIVVGHYLPSVKAGGPVQSVKNIVENLAENFDFYIITSDRDLGDNEPFNNVIKNEWNCVGNAYVFYTNTESLTLKKMKKIINEVGCDVLYLNSFFSIKFSILPIFLYKIKQINFEKVIIAPRGEFSPGSFNLKKIKKMLFTTTTKMLKVYKNVNWHATALEEKKDIEGMFKVDTKIEVASNLTANVSKLHYNKTIRKKTGELKIVFISRIHPKKNLKGAIEMLKGLQGNVVFNIYGPIEDEKYWEECMQVAENLQDNIQLNYKGVIEQKETKEVFMKHHLFLFPTHGENFGHVISESLLGACPVLISDQTPWRDLSKKGVGWDISLNKFNEYISCLNYMIKMDEKTFSNLAKNTFDYGKYISETNKDLEEYIKLFSIK